jgi:hypothetical protein
LATSISAAVDPVAMIEAPSPRCGNATCGLRQHDVELAELGQTVIECGAQLRGLAHVTCAIITPLPVFF